MFRLLQRFSRSPPPIDTSLWQHVRAATPWVGARDGFGVGALQALCARFLRQKTITPVAGLTLDAAQRMQLAALCCMPLLEFGHSGMQRWSQVIVYPNAFRVHRSHTDAAGVLHEWEEELIGESWGSGPLILSWEDVQADLAEPREGFCVVVHEMAHKLDALDGEMDGTPPLPREWHRRWVEDFQRAYDLFCADVDAGREMLIDAYAAEAPEEFFAVVSEYHFSAPALLRKTMPEVAAHLRRFYGPPPFL